MIYPRVRHFHRISGCDNRLISFFAWWSASGPFTLTIPQTGGIRWDEFEQARLYENGASKAKTLADTPHGRGAAVDAHIAILSPDESYVQAIRLNLSDPETRQMVLTYGEAAERHGLVWGGRFKPLDDDGLGWDSAHVETPDWRRLPFTPRTREYPW